MLIPTVPKVTKAVTIRDVAKKAETSIATVSYVLNNEDRYLRPELRERVIQAARELGYVKNAAARSLKGKQRGILAILVAQFGNSFFTRMCVSVEEVARREGYIVTICNSYEDPQQERFILERLITQRIDGCILCPALSKAENVEFLKHHRVPFVILERSLSPEFLPYAFVGHDNFQSGYMATKRLLEAGHRQIAFSGWNSPIPNVNERVSGYRAALQEYGVTPREELIFLGDLSQDAGQKIAEKILLSKATGAVLGQHDIAKGTLVHFQDKGVVWPRDISLVLIGTPEWTEILHPVLTCIKRPEKEMGKAAATLLLSNMKNPSEVETQQLFPCELIEGGSIIHIESSSR